jgi:hypothetical protein
MKMQAMVALRDFPYAGKLRKKGRSFDAAPKDARLLAALGRAQIDPASEPAVPPPAPKSPQPADAEVVREAAGLRRGPGRPRKTATYVRPQADYGQE